MRSTSFCWVHPCLGKEAGELSLLFVGKRSQFKHLSGTRDECEFCSEEKVNSFGVGILIPVL